MVIGAGADDATSGGKESFGSLPCDASNANDHVAFTIDGEAERGTKEVGDLEEVTILAQFVEPAFFAREAADCRSGMKPGDEGGGACVFGEGDGEFGLEVSEGSGLTKATWASGNLAEAGELGFEVARDEFVFLDFFDVLHERFVSAGFSGACEGHGFDLGTIRVEEEFRGGSGESVIAIDASVTPKTGRCGEDAVEESFPAALDQHAMFGENGYHFFEASGDDFFADAAERHFEVFGGGMAPVDSRPWEVVPGRGVVSGERDKASGAFPRSGVLEVEVVPVESGPIDWSFR